MSAGGGVDEAVRRPARGRHRLRGEVLRQRFVGRHGLGLGATGARGQRDPVVARPRPHVDTSRGQRFYRRRLRACARCWPISRRWRAPTPMCSILGENGTGKELVARAIHQRLAALATAAFVGVDLGAIPRSLFELELFGQQEGRVHRCAKRGSRGPLRMPRPVAPCSSTRSAISALTMQAKLLGALSHDDGDARGRR